MNKLKNLLIGMTMLVSSIMPVFAPAVVRADSTNSICSGSNFQISGKETKCVGNKDADKDLENLLKLIIRILQAVVGFLAVIMIIIGGFKYVMSGGESGGISSAKNTVLYAVVGIVIVAFAEVLVQFVINRISDV